MDFIFSRASHQHKHSERTPTRCTRQSSGLGLGRREGGKGYGGNDNEGYSDRLWDAGATKGGDRGNVNVSSQKINKTTNGCFQPGVLPSGSHLGDAQAKKDGWRSCFLRRKFNYLPKIEATRTWKKWKCGGFEGQ